VTSDHFRVLSPGERPEYCFHFTSISGVFLPDLMTFPALYSGIRSASMAGIIELVFYRKVVVETLFFAANANTKTGRIKVTFDQISIQFEI
jgi:hypothetical protein